MTNYASIVPLIGGETIAMQNVFGKEPEYIMSYSGFKANDNQLNSYYGNRIPYVLLDEGGRAPSKVDIVNSVCPCAGLSSLSVSSSADNQHNDWMVESSKYVIESVQPKVLWGENAPRLASKMGEPIVNKLRKIAKDNGYTFSLYKTKSKLHGLSQIRDRAFFFFWKGNAVPVFDYYNRPYTRIEDQIRSSASNTKDPMQEIVVRNDNPTDNPFYQYILEEMYGGISHTDFFKKIEKTTNVLHHFENEGHKYNSMANWMLIEGHQKHAEKCMRMYEKLKSGGNIMRKTTEIPKDYIGAFVGHMPHMLTHPDVDRYLTVRECLDIMKMPKDFELIDPIKNLNMICQNVPVTTAQDMASNVKKFIDDDIELVDTSFMVQDNKSKTLNYAQSSVQLDEFMV